MRRIRTDQGGKLAKSSIFRNLVCKHKYILETAGSGASFHNVLAERPHRTFGNMMHTILQGAGFPKKYWSYALLHAVYLKNKLPHRAVQTTPYEMFTGTRPDLSHLYVFGSFVTSKKTGDRATKLSSNVSHGIFLGYTANNRNIIFRDELTNQIKRARHLVFNDVHYHHQKRPPYAQQLYDFNDSTSSDVPVNKTPATTNSTTPKNSERNVTRDIPNATNPSPPKTIHT